MCELPGQWLRTVLQRLESEEQVFILRRSAGFAYTFLSILRAEPGNCRATLLPEAVHKLLQLGTEDLALYLPSETPMEHDGLSMRWRRCVHALNILRILLLDGTLGTEMDPYISVCCDLAVRGFLSTEWAIRNSAMMLFTAMVQRAIDSEKNDRGVGFHRTATVMEFFASFPSLHGLLLEQLRRQICLGAAEEKSLETVGHSTTSSLFPILLMFSKLRPAFTTAEISAKEHEYPVNEYVAFIMNCLCSRSFHIRQMASQALTSFIPLCSIVGTACDILGNVLTNCQLWSNNAIHGHMLTVNALFNSLYRYRQLVFQQVSGQEADRELVLQPVAELLRGLSSIILRLPTSSNTTPVTVSGAVHGCCPAVMYVYCQILKVLLALSPHHTSLCGLSQQLFDAVIGRTSHPFSVSVTSQLPFIALMWQESLCLGLKHLHRDCEAMIIPQVISLYDSCNVSEVRMGIISGLCETDLLERVALEEASVFFKRLSLLLTRENAKPQLRDLVLSALCRMLTSKCGLTVTIANNECTNELWQWAVHTSRLGMKGIATATTAIAIDTISTPSVQDIAHAIEVRTFVYS